MEKKFVFLDGFLIPASETLLKTMSPGILSGLGVFETLRAYQGVIFALDEHLERLFEGLRILKIDSPWTALRIKSYLSQSLKANKLKSARVRLMIWKSSKRVRISIATFPYRAISKKKYDQGFKAFFSEIRRDESVLDTRIKSVNYLPFLIAQRKAKVQGGDEAILLNKKGFLVEGSKTNLFFVKGKTLCTPALTCGCLKGITRGLIINMARKNRMVVKESMFLPQDLLNADEAFLTNSLLEVMPLTSVQKKPIKEGKIGMITQQLHKEYQMKIKRAIHQKF